MALNFGTLTDGLATQAIEPDITEATPGEVQGANIGATFDSLPAVDLLHQQQRYNESGPTTPWAGANDPRNQGSDVDAMAAERGDAPTRTTIQPEDANALAEKAGAKGLKFDRPIADTAAQSIIDDHVTAQQRASVIARNGNSILSGSVARFATSSLVSLADPLNDAAMLIPAAPEAFVAEKLAAASGVFERGLIRGVAGAANGAAGMAALEPMNYAMDQANYNDWSAGDALRNIFMGAAMGAAGHMVLGGLFGREHLDEGTAIDATKAAVAQTVNDRPVDVADLVNHAEATQAADTIQRGPLDNLNPDGVPTADQGAVMYRGGRSGSGLPDPENTRQEDIKAVWLSNNREVAEGFAGDQGKVSDIHVQPGTYFDFRNPEEVAALQAHLATLPEPPTNFLEGAIAPHIGKGAFAILSHPDVQAWLHSQGYDGYLEREGLGGKNGLSLAVFNKDKISFASDLRAQATQAAKDMADRAMNPPTEPDIVRATRSNKAAIDTAPAIIGDISKDHAEASRMEAEAKAEFDARTRATTPEGEEPAVHPDLERSLAAADDIGKEGKASADYATCLIARGSLG